MNESQKKSYQKYKENHEEIKIRFEKGTKEKIKNRMYELNITSYQEYLTKTILSDLQKNT